MRRSKQYTLTKGTSVLGRKSFVELIRLFSHQELDDIVYDLLG